MSVAGGNFNPPKRVIGIKPVRSLREASIDVAAGNTVVGLHRFTFTDTYFFNSWGSARAGNFVTGSLIHENVGSKNVVEGASIFPAWYNAADNITADRPNELSRNIDSPADITDQIVSVPMEGCNKLSFGLSVWDSADQTSSFKITLFRRVNIDDSTTFMGTPGDQAMEVMSWGPIQSVITGDNTPNFQTFAPIELNIATQIFLKIENLDSAVNVNRIAGSIFFHG